MKSICVLTLMVSFVSCVYQHQEGEFFVTELIPQSGEFEGALSVAIKFSKPLNKDGISFSDIQLLDSQQPINTSNISHLEINEARDMVTIYSENVEPGKYYRILIKGRVLSEDKMLLSYYYGGNFISDDSYFIKKKQNIDPCIVINEVLNYASDICSSEFIEIFNCSNYEVDLRGYYIVVDDNKPQKLLFRNKGYKLPPHTYRVIISDIKELTNEPLIYIQGRFGKNGLSNSSLKTIKLFNESGRLMSEFKPFDKAKRGVSFERIDPFNKKNERNWGYSISTSGCTPNSENSIYLRDIFPPTLSSINIIEKDMNFEIFVEFDEEVICESMGCLYLLTNERQPIYGATEVYGKKIIFRPTSTINYSTEYLLITTPSFKDVAGNSYKGDYEIGRFTTPEMPLIKLQYPQTYYIPSNIRYFEFLSRSFRMNEEKVYFKGVVQVLNLLCVNTIESNRYLCTPEEGLEGPEEMCLFISDKNTNICVYFGEPVERKAPILNIKHFFQIKNQIYIEADSSIPCLLFVDFIYKEDFDERFLYSKYIFSQSFEYKIELPDPYKEYLVDVYCVDIYNNWSESKRFNTDPYSEDGISLIINEVLQNPFGNDTAGEFIEILNTGVNKVISENISISDCSERMVGIKKMTKTYLLPGETAIIVSLNSYFFNSGLNCEILAGAEKIIGRDLKNTTLERLCLYYNGKLVDYYNSNIVGAISEGLSINRVKKDLYFESSNWSVLNILGGTPCIGN